MKSFFYFLCLSLLLIIPNSGLKANNTYLQRYIEIVNTEGKPINNAKIQMILLPVVYGSMMPSGGGPMGEVVHPVGNGIYNLDSLLPEGIYRIIVSASGYKTATFHRQLPYGNIAKTSVILAKSGTKNYYINTGYQMAPQYVGVEYLSIEPKVAGVTEAEVQAEIARLKEQMPNLSIDGNNKYCLKWPESAEDRQKFESFIRKSKVIQGRMLKIDGTCSTGGKAVYSRLTFFLENEADTNKIKAAMPRFNCVFKVGASHPLLGPPKIQVVATYNRTISADFFEEIEKVCAKLPVVNVSLISTVGVEIPEDPLLRRGQMHQNVPKPDIRRPK